MISKWQLFKLNRLLEKLNIINNDLISNKKSDLIKEEYQKKLQLNILQLKIKYTIKEIKLIIDQKSIKNKEFFLLEFYYLLSLDIFKDNIFFNLIKDTITEHIDKDKFNPFFLQFIYWNLILELFCDPSSHPLLRFVHEEINFMSDSKNANELLESFQKNIEFQIHSRILYSQTKSFLQKENIQINLINFNKNNCYYQTKKKFALDLLNKYNLSDNHYLKAVHVLFNEHKGFFFKDKEVIRRAKQIQFIDNL